MMRHNFRVLRSAGAALALCALVATTASCKKQEAKPGGPPPVPVLIGAAEKRDVPMEISTIGTVEPFSTIAVKAQIGGTLIRVHFTEGQDVKKGDLLFTIDPRPYEAALMQAEAALARSTAQHENARAEERRYAELVKKGYVAQTQYEQVRTNADALAATVQSDRALAENARLNLGYCTIRSPLSGRTGTLIVHEGNLVKANADSAMVTIHQIQPVQVAFAVPEKGLPEIKRRMAGGTLKVEAFLSREDRAPIAGRLSFIENTVDTATGTIKLKATFENRDRKLWPGQFVTAVLTLSVQKDALVVPTAAVQTGQQGTFVFVVKDDQSVEVRPFTAGLTYRDVTAVEQGIKAGERVVTDGQMRLVPGAKVEMREQKGTASPAAQAPSTGQGTTAGSGKETGAPRDSAK